MSLSRHESIIQRLAVKYRADRHGLAKQMRDLLNDAWEGEGIPKNEFFPRVDLFLAIPKESRLIIWEVEDNHRLSQSQLGKLSWFIYDLYDLGGWETELRVVDCYGNENVMVIHRTGPDTHELFTPEESARTIEAYDARMKKRFPDAHLNPAAHEKAMAALL